jgi:multiple sugar transport system substrate-binding protein
VRHLALGLVLTLAAGAGCANRGQRQVTLRVVNWAPELELAMEQRIADRFSERHPGVRVVVESVASNFGEKLVTSIVSGSPPDVFLLDVPDIPAFVDRGLVLDLAPYARRVGYQPAAAFPEVLRVFQRGERLYAFPKDFTPMVLYYNRRVFRQAGVEPPPEEGWTRDQFLAAARELTRDRDGDGRTDVYGIDFPRNLYEWIPWVWSGGGDILDPAGIHTAGHLDSPQTVETFRFLSSLVQLGVAPPVQFLRAGDPSRTNRFFSGKQAMLQSGHWSMPLLAKYAARGQLEVGVAGIPHAQGVRSQTVIYVSGWAVPSNVRHKRWAVELAGFLSGEEAQRIRVRTRLGISALRSVARETAEQDATGVEQAFLKQVEQGRMPWGAVVKDFHEIEQMSFDVMDRHLLRGEDLAAAAADVARAIDAARAQ